MKAALSLLQRRPHYRRFWLANLTSLLGDWLTYVAVSILALERGEGALAIAFVLIAHHFPQAVLSPFAGSIVDRFDRKKVMMFATGTQAVLTAAMAVAAFFGVLYLVQLFLLLRMAMVAFFDTAESASVPRLVEVEELGLANSLSAGSWSVMYALGVALGGVLVALVGPIAAISIDAFTFVIATVLLAGLPSIAPRHDTASGAKGIGSAWSFAESRPDILTAMFAKAPLAFASGAAWIYLVQSTGHWAMLGASAIALGALQAMRGIGTGVGPIVALVAESRGAREGGVLTASAVAGAVGMLLFALAGGPGVALFAALIWGMGTGANWVKSTSMLQRLAPDGYRGRLAAIDLLASAFAMCAGAFSGASAIDAGAQPWTAPIVGIVFGAIAFTAVRIFSQRLRNSLA